MFFKLAYLTAFWIASTFPTYSIDKINNNFIEKNKITEQEPYPHGWEEILPAGDTICARGEPFSFFVNKGSTNKIIIDFIGGGACWNNATCNKNNPTFIDSVDYIRKKARKGLKGIYDHTNTSNPLVDFTHIVIPYCTGDIHWGEKDTDYTDHFGETYTIHHKGATNVKAVLKWLQNNYTVPKKILITGCSAGSYGSIYWLPQIVENHPTSQVYQLGDSGVGIITSIFNKTARTNWHYLNNMPTWIPAIKDKLNNDINLIDIYTDIGRYYPNARLAQFTSAHDQVQKFFYEIMGGNPSNWPNLAKNYFTNIANNIDNFNYFHSKGNYHCITPYEKMYDTEQDNINFAIWLKDLVNDKLLENVICDNCTQQNINYIN